MGQWRDCVIGLLDLADTMKRQMQGRGKASETMRRLHRSLAEKSTMPKFEVFEQCYVWNDSVLLIAYVDETRVAYERTLKAISSVKRAVDAIAPSYAIIIKGKAFPENSETAKVTVMKTSSYAMANCFEVEAEAKRQRLRGTWYIDSRIGNKVASVPKREFVEVSFLPDRKRRNVHVCDGYFDEPSL
jgi:hypothetical protein